MNVDAPLINVEQIIKTGWPSLSSCPHRGIDSLDPRKDTEFVRFVYLQTFAEVPRYPAGLMLWPLRTEQDLSRFIKTPWATTDRSHEWLRQGLAFTSRMLEFGWARRKAADSSGCMRRSKIYCDTILPHILNSWGTKARDAKLTSIRRWAIGIGNYSLAPAIHRLFLSLLNIVFAALVPRS